MTSSYFKIHIVNLETNQSNFVKKFLFRIVNDMEVINIKLNVLSLYIKGVVFLSLVESYSFVFSELLSLFGSCSFFLVQCVLLFFIPIHLSFLSASGLGNVVRGGKKSGRSTVSTVK